MNLPNRQNLIEEASHLTELNDFGSTWFFDHIDHLIAALNTEARLTTEGSYGAQAMIVGALSNRLRHIALIKAHPEILEEDVQVAVIVTGLPRTGSTMLHRMLASSRGMTGVRWYEAQNYAPFPGEIRAEATQRMNDIANAFAEVSKVLAVAIPDPAAVGEVYGRIFDLQRQSIESSIQVYHDQVEVLDQKQRDLWNLVREKMLEVAGMSKPAQ